MVDNRMSRRGFFQISSMASGSALLDPLSNVTRQAARSRLSREVWIAGFSLMGIDAETPELLVPKIFDKLKALEAFGPDILCLPEMFCFFNVTKETTLEEKVSISEKVLEQFSGYCKKNNCYAICPLIISQQGKIYNAAVVLDRKGNRVGDYKKIRVTPHQIAQGVMPGPPDPPVFQTDFGTIGIQICWDINWEEGWRQLRKKGADIIFWPSAYAGGKVVEAMAWQNKCIVVSSTVKNTARICDIAGQVIAQTGIWEPNLFCRPVNLDKVFIPTWPFSEHFHAIQQKYGRNIGITTFHEEEWTIFESLSPEINLKEILKEYKIPTYEEYLLISEAAERKAREQQ